MSDVTSFEFYRRAAAALDPVRFGRFDAIIASSFPQACERFADLHSKYVKNGDTFVVTGPHGSSVAPPQARVFTIDYKPRWKEGEAA